MSAFLSAACLIPLCLLQLRLQLRLDDVTPAQLLCVSAGSSFCRLQPSISVGAAPPGLVRLCACSSSISTAT